MDMDGGGWTVSVGTGDRPVVHGGGRALPGDPPEQLGRPREDALMWPLSDCPYPPVRLTRSSGPGRGEPYGRECRLWGEARKKPTPPAVWLRTCHPPSLFLRFPLP